MKYTIISVCEGTRDTYKTGKSYEDKAIRLARSIRAAGDFETPIVMWYGKDKPPSDDTAKRLEAFGCKLVSGECLFPEHPLFNKVEAMATVQVDTPAVLWIDTDVYVKNAGGLDYFARLGVDIAASQDAYAHHAMSKDEDISIWEAYYKLADIELNTWPRCTTAIDGKEANFYMNTGVIYMKNDSNLRSLYKSHSLQVLQSNLGYSKNYYDAIGLTLTVLKTNRSFQFLPESLNYYYALRRDVNGLFIHYQDNILNNIEGIDWNI